MRTEQEKKREEQKRTEQKKRRKDNRTKQNSREQKSLPTLLGIAPLILCPAARKPVSLTRVILLFNYPKTKKSDGRDCGHKMSAP
jgi:hypothetical protein